MPTLAYSEVRPQNLDEVVRCVWTLQGRSTGEDVPEPIVPDGSVEVVLNLGDPMEQVTDGGGGSLVRQAALMMAGQGTRPVVVRPTGSVDLVGIRLQPWASRAVLDPPAHELQNRIVPLEGSARAFFERLSAELSETQTLETRLELAVARIAQLVRPPGRSVGRALVTAIREATSLPSVRELSARLGITVRTVQRTFSDDVGVSPKTLLRITRLHRAIRLARGAPRLSWGAIAGRTGYHDQSHLIRDFRQFVGCLPSQFLARQNGITESMLEPVS